MTTRKKPTRRMPNDAAVKYATEVLKGRLLACKYVQQACQRFINDLQNPGPYIYNQQAAEAACEFFPLVLNHSKGKHSGTPFHLEPWQQFIISNLFGWQDPNGLRRYRTAYIEIPRKNGKTTLAAGVAMACAVLDGEGGPEIYFAATKRDQARIGFNEASNMVRQSPILSQRLNVFTNAIAAKAGTGTIQPLSSDSKTLDGLNTHCAIIDEIHAHPDSRVIDLINTSTSARQQPLVLEITTAGSNRNSVCWEHHEYTTRVLSGAVDDPTWFGIIYTIDEGDDWKTATAWAKANPNYSVSKRPEYMQEQFTKAANMTSYQNTFQRLDLNVWTDSVTRWLSAETYAKGSAPLGNLTGRRCCAGLDLASTNDLTSLVLAFEPDEDGIYDLMPFFFCPADTAHERSLRDKVDYKRWAASGNLILTPGNVTDYDYILQTIETLPHTINALLYDRYNAPQVIQKIEGLGVPSYAFGQGFISMSAPTKEMERLMLSGRIRHAGHPVLAWNFANAMLQLDPAGNVKIAKNKSTERVDGAVAAVMALAGHLDPEIMPEADSDATYF